MTDSSDSSFSSKPSLVTCSESDPLLDVRFKDLPEDIQQALDSIPLSSHYVVALSGGLDSSLLLVLISRYLREFRQVGVSAIHVHHGLSDFADDWQHYCESLCQRLGVPLTVERVSIDGNKGGIEAAARHARYGVFEKQLPADGVLLQGHHQNDQAETVLLRLMRGAGVTGIAGIPQTRLLSLGSLYRPLLSIPRSTLTQIALTIGLEWVEDDSNTNTDFDRNFIRHEILPRLESRWKGAVKRLSVSSAHCRDSVEIEQALAEIDLAAVSNNQVVALNNLVTIDIGLLTGLSTVRQANVVRYWLQRYQLGFPGERNFQRIWNELILARDDAMPEIKWTEGIIRRYRGTLFVESGAENRMRQSLNADTAITLRYPPDKQSAGVVFDQVLGGFQYRIVAPESEGLCIRSPHHDEVISIRFRSAQGPFRVAGRPHHRPLKKWFNDYSVPPWLRDSIPLLYYNESLVAIGDLCVAEGFQADVESAGIVVSWKYIN